MRRFKVGDKVRIKSLDGYVPMASQGLQIGNTGTVLFDHGHCYGVRTDNAESERDSLCCDGEGWTFFDEQLEPYTEAE